MFYVSIDEPALAQPVEGDGQAALAWQAYAPVEYMKDNNLHFVKTYFFNANPNSQSDEDVLKLKQVHDSIAPITIGKVFMNTVEDAHGLSSSTWYWWSVKENDKTYILAYIPMSYRTGASTESYYKITFKDGTSYKWQEPHDSPYNFYNMFILLDGSMQAMNRKSNEHFRVDADIDLKEKFLSTPVHYITKYNGYSSEDGSETKIEYEPALQYVFSDKEAAQLKQTLQVMLSNLTAAN